MRRTAYILDKAPNFITCGQHTKGYDTSQWKQSNQVDKVGPFISFNPTDKDMINNNYTSVQVRKQYLCCTSYTQKCNHIVKDGESCNIVNFKPVNLDDSLTSSFMSIIWVYEEYITLQCPPHCHHSAGILCTRAVYCSSSHALDTPDL